MIFLMLLSLRFTQLLRLNAMVFSQFFFCSFTLSLSLSRYLRFIRVINDDCMCVRVFGCVYVFVRARVRPHRRFKTRVRKSVVMMQFLTLRTFFFALIEVGVFTSE